MEKNKKERREKEQKEKELELQPKSEVNKEEDYYPPRPNSPSPMLTTTLVPAPETTPERKPKEEQKMEEDTKDSLDGDSKTGYNSDDIMDFEDLTV